MGNGDTQAIKEYMRHSRLIVIGAAKTAVSSYLDCGGQKRNGKEWRWDRINGKWKGIEFHIALYVYSHSRLLSNNEKGQKAI